MFLCALAAGTLSAWGVGGGTLLLLVLTLLLGVDQRQAQTLNLLFFLPAAGAALLFHSRHGQLDAAAVRRTALPGALAALAGAVAAGLADTALLRRPFGLFLLWAGLSLLGGGRRAGRGGGSGPGNGETAPGPEPGAPSSGGAGPGPKNSGGG